MVVYFIAVIVFYGSMFILQEEKVWNKNADRASRRTATTEYG